MISILLFFTLFLNPLFSMDRLQDQMESIIPDDLPELVSNLERFGVNKDIPDEIREVTLLALSHYPELLDVKIDFQFQTKIRGSVMQAQPKVGSLLFNNKDNRTYRIKISRHLELLDEMVLIEDLPHEVLLGWIGHELGHIKDYLDRSAVNLMSFGVRYVFSNKFVTQAEITADSHSVANGLGKAIIATKDFVLNHDRLPEAYKDKIRALYMSPGEILSLVDVEEEQ
ncbi:MAG TPA: hypothetical protein VKX33_05880 [Cyclobacteriaceae bacterium]|nr:hypothetical protein [Cyclobacteriaceae bacterium]